MRISRYAVFGYSFNSNRDKLTGNSFVKSGDISIVSTLLIKSIVCTGSFLHIFPVARQPGTGTTDSALFNESIAAEVEVTTLNDNIFSIDQTVGVFQIPAVGGTDFVNAGGDVCTGEFSDVGDHGFAVITARNVASVDHDIAVGS